MRHWALRQLCWPMCGKSRASGGMIGLTGAWGRFRFAEGFLFVGCEWQLESLGLSGGMGAQVGGYEGAVIAEICKRHLVDGEYGNG